MAGTLGKISKTVARSLIQQQNGTLSATAVGVQHQRSELNVFISILTYSVDVNPYLSVKGHTSFTLRTNETSQAFIA